MPSFAQIHYIMKKFLLLTLLGISTLGKTQQYLGITMDPATPTDADVITFYIEMQFPSMPCDGTSSASVMGTSIDGSSTHCMGMLSAICNDFDTLTFGPLAAGNYNLDLTLSAGYAPSCSPPLVPNDDILFPFTVTTTLGVKDFGRADKLEVFPNPARDYVNINWTGSLESPLQVNLVDQTGRLVATGSLNGKGISLQAEPGIYFIQLPEKGICKKVVIE